MTTDLPEELKDRAARAANEAWCDISGYEPSAPGSSALTVVWRAVVDAVLAAVVEELAKDRDNAIATAGLCGVHTGVCSNRCLRSQGHDGEHDDDPESTRTQLKVELVEARSWARHGYEIGQRSLRWSDHGVAPKWLTEGWPTHFETYEDIESAHLKLKAERDELRAAVRMLRRVRDKTIPFTRTRCEQDAWDRLTRLVTPDTEEQS